MGDYNMMMKRDRIHFPGKSYGAVFADTHGNTREINNVIEIETRVTTAIAAREQAGYLKRGQNIPRIFANSILSKNAQQAIEKINSSSNFDELQKMKATRIIKKLFSTKSKKHSNDEIAESRVDYISDHLGIVKEEVIRIITLLREEKILADTKDLTAYIKQGDQINRSLSIVKSFVKMENFLLLEIEDQIQEYNLKKLNEAAFESECFEVNPDKIKTILNFWAIKNWIKRRTPEYSKNHVSVNFTTHKKELELKQKRRHDLSIFIVNYLFEKSKNSQNKVIPEQNDGLVEFSVHELKEAYKNKVLLFQHDISVDDIEDTLFYLSRIEAIKIEGGFLVVYNRLTIDRLEQNNQIQYKNDDYRQFDLFYQNKMQQIHIVGEYAIKMLEDYEAALKFVEDYFQLNYSSFLNKYFPGSRKDEIKRNITPSKFRQLFGTLSPRQLAIIQNDRNNIVVAAGPGSGKTRVLVHKLASLLLMEDVKHEQLLMLTFSRAATTEFKKRLLGLIGNAANFIEIKTFHSFCFDLLGRVGNLEKSDKIIQSTTKKIINGEVEINRITKTVLVIDEAQDMNSEEFGLIKALMNKNEDMRVIAVGDDDQNIYTFRKADSKYFEQFIEENDAIKYELIENYRSKKNLVEFTNNFAEKIHHRLKFIPIVPIQQDKGEIRIFHHKSNNLIVPLVNDILNTDLSGTIGVLTISNNEALHITGMLLNNGISAKLIQSNDGFDLMNLVELRSFLDDLKTDESAPIMYIDDWNRAKKAFVRKHASSTNFELCKKIIMDFQETNPKIKYRSDFEDFIKESKLDDFNPQQNDVINVSTIHKAKGKEFDHVFMMLDGFDANSDDDKRLLYVAMTRAKQNLSIHYNGNYFNKIDVENMHLIKDENTYSAPKHLVYHLTHKDIYLGYFAFIQQRIHALQSGQELFITDEGLANSNAETIVKFSKSYKQEKTVLEQKGFRLIEAKINMILYWKIKEMDAEAEKEIKIVLPELSFQK